MKIGYFNDFRLGVVKGENVVDVTALAANIPHTGPHDLINGVIERFVHLRAAFEAHVAKEAGVAISSVKIRPPLPRPVNIDCMAVNYMEDGTRKEPAPINGFHKSPAGIISDGDVMVLPDVPATVFEGEAEIAIVIGKHASNVPASKAMDYIFGYTNFIDGSARGLPPAGNTFYQMKSRETFAPVGPWIVTADEIKDVHNLQVKLWNNGIIRQNYNTSDMAHKIPRCVEFVSSLHALVPGDLIPAGTNHRGLHAFQDGDKIEIETEGLGRLHIAIRDDLKRVWSRETRLERQDKGLDPIAPQFSGKFAPAK